MSESLTLESLAGLPANDGPPLPLLPGEAAATPAVEVLCDDCEARLAEQECTVGGVNVSLCQSCLARRTQNVHVVNDIAALSPGPASVSPDHADQMFQPPPKLFSAFLVVGADTRAPKSPTNESNGSDRVDMSPDLLFMYPEPNGPPAEFDVKHVVQFCFPSGSVPIRKVKRTQDGSSLAALLLGVDPVLGGPQLGHSRRLHAAAAVATGKDGGPTAAVQLPLGPLTSAFTFVLNCGDNKLLWACCMKRTELVARPPSFLGDGPAAAAAAAGGAGSGMYTASGREPLQAGDGSSFKITQRCYVLVSELPCFSLHFAVLRVLMNQERLLVLSEFRREMRHPRSLCERCGSRSVAARVALAPQLTVELCKECTLETQAVAARIKKQRQLDEEEEAKRLAAAADSTDSACSSYEDDDDNDDDDDDGDGNGDGDGDGKNNVSLQSGADSASQPAKGGRRRRKVKKVRKPAGGGRSRSRTGGPAKGKKQQQSAAVSLLDLYAGAQVPRPGQVLSFLVPGESDPRTYAVPTTLYGLVQSTAEQAGEFFLCAAVRQLPLDQFLMLLRAALLEQRILIVSRDLSALSAVVLSVQALLLPFHWCGLLIPVLSDSMQDFLDAPVPYIIGLTRISGSRSRDCLIFELDVGKVSWGGAHGNNDRLPSLPEGKKLRENLRENYDRLRASLMLVGAGAGSSHSPLATSSDQLARSRAILTQLGQWHDWLLTKVRRHFSSIIELSGFLDSRGESGEQAKSSFLGQVSAVNRAYVRALFETQHFSYFFEQFCLAKNKWKKDRSIKSPVPSPFSDHLKART